MNLMAHQNMMQQQSISSMGGGTPITQLRRDITSLPVSSSPPSPALSSSGYDEMNGEENKMKFLVDEINNDSDIGPRKKKVKTVYIETETEEQPDEKPKKKKKSSSFNIPEIFKDSILIWIIYMLMSQNFFKNLVGKYLTSINPNEEGIVTFSGIAMYGLVLVTLYILIKFILKQMWKS
jgi:hypothetical protein